MCSLLHESLLVAVSFWTTVLKKLLTNTVEMFILLQRTDAENCLNLIYELKYKDFFTISYNSPILIVNLMKESINHL
ncbi:hypothetical protein T08_4576 [Trichinella sp. T8]|nr:hypothetical protein T08_4576 [Trichinella sp. T8]